VIESTSPPRSRKLTLKNPETGSRFAVPRCWSRGDSNRRSSLRFLALAKRSKFQQGHCAEADQRIVLRAVFWAKSGGKGGTRASFPRGKRPKRTGSSNLLRSSNESVRTTGSLRVFFDSRQSVLNGHYLMMQQNSSQRLIQAPAPVQYGGCHDEFAAEPAGHHDGLKTTFFMVMVWRFVAAVCLIPLLPNRPPHLRPDAEAAILANQTTGSISLGFRGVSQLFGDKSTGVPNVGGRWINLSCEWRYGPCVSRRCLNSATAFPNSSGGDSRRCPRATYC
jgi:hypothetical protein